MGKLTGIVIVGGGIAALLMTRKHHLFQNSNYGSNYHRNIPANTNRSGQSNTNNRQGIVVGDYRQQYQSQSPLDYYGSTQNTTYTLPHKRYPVLTQGGTATQPATPGYNLVRLFTGEVVRLPKSGAPISKPRPTKVGNWWGTSHTPLFPAMQYGGYQHPKPTPQQPSDYYTIYDYNQPYEYNKPYDYNQYNPPQSYSQPYSYYKPYSAPYSQPSYSPPPNYYVSPPSYSPPQNYTSPPNYYATPPYSPPQNYYAPPSYTPPQNYYAPPQSYSQPYNSYYRNPFTQNYSWKDYSDFGAGDYSGWGGSYQASWGSLWGQGYSGLVG